MGEVCVLLLLANFADACLLTSEISTRDIKPQGVNMPHAR
jgi:hypothetical protein